MTEPSIKEIRTGKSLGSGARFGEPTGVFIRESKPLSLLNWRLYDCIFSPRHTFCSISLFPPEILSPSIIVALQILELICKFKLCLAPTDTGLIDKLTAFNSEPSLLKAMSTLKSYHYYLDLMRFHFYLQNLILQYVMFHLLRNHCFGGLLKK